jgi:hypothetical protein
VPFFSVPAELQVGPRFCWSSTFFVLLIEKGGKKPGKKRREWQKEKGAKKGYCEQP